MSDKLLIAYYEMVSSEQAEPASPKMMYFSTTTQSLYVMHSFFNTAFYINVSVIRGCQINGHKVEKFEVAIPADSMFPGMDKCLVIFNDFLKKHINREDYSDLLYKWNRL